MKDQLDAIRKVSALVQRRSEGHTQAVISDIRSSLQVFRTQPETNEKLDQIQSQQYLHLCIEETFQILGERVLNGFFLGAHAYLDECRQLHKEILVTSKVS